jgi:(E)-4-hydroxy-3-methylbut-2-enyl-diphosphate synthase
MRRLALGAAAVALLQACSGGGSGECKLANIGISLPGTGENPAAPVYVDNEKTVTLRGRTSQYNLPVSWTIKSHENMSSGKRVIGQPDVS